jgi:hypothetical protein
MRKCKTCTAEKPDGDFYPRCSSCKECVKARVRVNYASHRADRSAYERERSKRPERRLQMKRSVARRRARRPEREHARIMTGNAIRDGRLVRQPCEVCRTTLRVQAHHDDYSKPLDVRWLCFKHHREHHGQVVIAE